MDVAQGYPDRTKASFIGRLPPPSSRHAGDEAASPMTRSRATMTVSACCSFIRRPAWPFKDLDMIQQHPTPNLVGRHIVILCHPDQHSFNHSVADAYCAAVRANGQDVIFRDLYAMGFDPVLKASERPTIPDFKRSTDVEREIATIEGGDVFVLVYPIWFGSAPAMMKGYVERVLGAGVDPQDVHDRHSSSLLGGKRLLSFSTSATKTIWLDEQGEVQALRDVFDRYLVDAFGMHSEKHVNLGHVTADLSKRFANQHLMDVAEQAKRTCSEVASALIKTNAGAELQSTH